MVQHQACLSTKLTSGLVRCLNNEYDFTKDRKNPYASLLNKDNQLKPIPHFKDEESEKMLGRAQNGCD